MPKKRRHPRGKTEHRHVRVYHWVMKSVAWRDLTPNARALLIQLYALYNSANNGQLYLSVRKAAADINVSKKIGRAHV